MDTSLREQLRTLREGLEIKPLDPRVESALVALARGGLPEQPRVLQLRTVKWGGTFAPEVGTIALEEDGGLRLEATPPSSAAIVPDPRKWSTDCFAAEIPEHGMLTIAEGASSITRVAYGDDGSQVTAVLRGWKWSAGSSTGRTFWAARLLFATPQPPVVLWGGTGNLLLAVEDALVRGWRFATQSGAVYLVPNDDDWYIGLDCEGSPGAQAVHVARSAIGFVFGQPLNVGVFRPVGPDGTLPGLVQLGLLRHAWTRKNRQPPALPFDCRSALNAEFIDRIIACHESEIGAPILPVAHLYFAALAGSVESNFLHAWVAAEALAKWALDSARLPDGGRRRVAEHEAWVAWVKEHREEIERLAAPNMGARLVDRVRGSEIDRPTPVQRVFDGSALPWTEAMEDVQLARHSVAHEAAFPEKVRDWDRDRARVGLVKTILTALVAKVVGYAGPIADRSKTSFEITAKDEPEWWSAAGAPPEVQYEGSGVERVHEQLLANLPEERPDSEPDGSDHS